MESTVNFGDLLFLSPYHQSNIDNQRQNQHENRTPSPSSSSSASSTHNMEDQDMDPFYTDFLSVPTDFQAELEMDLFPDAEALDTFSELQREEQLRHELMFSSGDININQFLEGDSSSLNSCTDTVPPFQIEFNNNESLSNSPSSMFMTQNENSTSSASSSVDIDLNIEGRNGLFNNAATFMDTFALSPSLDTPPLTPPEMKVDISAHDQGPTQLIFVNNNGAAVLSGNNSSNLPPRLISPLKSNKRGRSASHDDTPDVQALKRHIRMIRNRESASLSRKKKKEYVTGLEDRIKELEKENEVLKKENLCLRSKLQQTGVKSGVLSTSSSSNQKKKRQVGIVAKVALLGLFGFVMVNFHTPSKHLHPEEHSNLSEFSRTLTKLKLSESDVAEGDDEIPQLLGHRGRFVPRDALFNTSRSNLPLEAKYISGNYSNLSNISTIHLNSTLANLTVNVPLNSTSSTPHSYLNGTNYSENLFNQTLHVARDHPSSRTYDDFDFNSTLKKKEREGSNSSYRWRSRGVGNKKKLMMGAWSSSTLKSSSLVFPSFMGSVGVNNSSNLSDSSKQTSKCPNPFNKTESMRVKSDLEDIFGKGKFPPKKQKAKLGPVVKREPIVYSLISHNSYANAGPIAPREEGLDVNKGLAVYDGDKKKFSTILDKLERREDTFYVVSLASDSQLLLSAKSSNESSRPKMTLLLPWRNETLNEDMILQIDCEVFQVFNLNEKKKSKRQRAAA